MCCRSLRLKLESLLETFVDYPVFFLGIVGEHDE